MSIGKSHNYIRSEELSNKRPLLAWKKERNPCLNMSSKRTDNHLTVSRGKTASLWLQSGRLLHQSLGESRKRGHMGNPRDTSINNQLASGMAVAWDSLLSLVFEVYSYCSLSIWVDGHSQGWVLRPTVWHPTCAEAPLGNTHRLSGYARDSLHPVQWWFQ